MKTKILYLFIVLALPLLSFGNDDVHALFAKGNTFYARAQYKEAFDAYKQIEDDGYQSAGLYFNMGNASYKLDEIPSAVLYYEKAHKLAPNDEDINANLQLADSKTTDKVEAAPELFLTRWWDAFILTVPLSGLAAISIILFLGGSALLILYFFATAFTVKKSSFIAAIILFITGILTVLTAGSQQHYFDSNRQAIVFNSSVTVKSGPVDKASSLFVIHDGTKVNIVDDNDGWMKIKLANGNEGWIKAADVKEI